jgi:preprotein translocase subunit SecG
LHIVAKIIIGILLVIGSAWWIAQGSQAFIGRSGIADLITVINGALPVLVFVLGIFIVWLELDELRIERELKAEEEKEKKAKRKK